MKILVTGAGGQLGQEVVREALRRGHEVVALDHRGLDIADLAAVRSAVGALGSGPAAVVNGAAWNDVDGAESHPEEAHRTNALGPRNLAIAARECGAAFMHFGTDYVFDGTATMPYAIDAKPAPLGAYARSKHQGEDWVLAEGGSSFVVRVSWVFGAAAHAFPRKVLEWAKTRKTLRVVTDSVSSPSYAPDLAPAVLDLLGSGAFGLHHLANSGSCSKWEWARFVVRECGLDVDVQPALRADFPGAARPAWSVLDTTRTCEILCRTLPTWEDATRRFLRA